MRLTGLAVVGLLSMEAAPGGEELDTPCAAIKFGVLTEQELVDRIGPPCFVESSRFWDAYRQDTRPRRHRFVYARYCSVGLPEDCTTREPAKSDPLEMLRCAPGLSHTASRPEALAEVALDRDHVLEVLDAAHDPGQL